MTEYDLIVIGAGPVGENVADYATKAGLSTVIIERELVGGECSYWACTPSKALLRPGAARDAALAVQGAAQSVTAPLDADAVFKRRDGFTGRGDDSGQVEWLESAHIPLVRGEGRLTGERRVEVTRPDGETLTLTARHAVAVCTGSTSRIPEIEGLSSVGAWTNREVTTAEKAPASLAIIGGGVVAAEMATAYLSLGSTVTLVVRGKLLSKLEPIAGDAVTKRLTDDGAKIVPGEVERAARTDDGVALTLTDGSEVRAEKVLVATGRAPRSTDLGLETIGLEDGAWIEVDDTMRATGVDGGWLYAVGDVNHRNLLTHQGKYQARAAAAAISARARGDVPSTEPWSSAVATADHAATPSVVFSQPQVCSIGLTSAKAQDRGIRSKTLDIGFGSVAGAALHADGYTGTMRAVIDVERGTLVGATFVGDDTAEMLHAATIAVVGEVPLHRLWHAVPAFPTMSEIWLRLLEKLHEESA
ncbi:dihydrolipoamide dehydrogenase [Paramicrobacterium humi]|uniref:Dihydrolipoamide dehydrogenase n=1 Tax=Paramicrobacterium humi TaxID=640635 RepID=A0A1H4PAT6_9MICO|nr:NAD(P)/FAD-dependent oxidoreductase [Microbacterium humi]SEC04122.1 dihydrolipoamide dehydrogenase [Microbacterium humi]